MAMQLSTEKFKVNDYQFSQKDKEWLEKSICEYTALIGTSEDLEASFAAKEKDWLAAMKLGRQSARDRFKAGKILVAIQAKITDELGYPFWPWLKATGVPEKTAQRAIELTKFYKSEDRLGDKTITECYVEMKAAKTKTKAKDVKNDKVDHANTEENDDGKLGNDTDTVSLPLPNLTKNEPKASHNGDKCEDDQHVLGQEEKGETDKSCDQVSLLVGLDEIEVLLHACLKSMSGDLSLFPAPEEVVKKIDACLDLFDQLKVQVPTHCALTGLTELAAATGSRANTGPRYADRGMN